MQEWNVRLDGQIIDTVFYTTDMEDADVYSSLVDHDGMDPEIEVERRYS